MMGTSHALTGVIVGSAALVAPAPWPVRILALAVTGGAALLPDIDHPSSTVAHTLGPITWAISHGVDKLAVSIYHATRTRKDPASRESGHRLITHVPVGAVSFGLIAAVACWADPVSAGVTIGLVVGLLTAAFRRATRVLVKATLGLREGSGFLVALVSGVAGYLVSMQYPGWWWVYGVAVALGAHIHREGDWCTNSGVPRRLWPLVKNGRRWDKSKAPITFETGKETELYVVRRLLYLGTALSLGLTTGVVQLLVMTVIHAVQVAHDVRAGG